MVSASATSCSHLSAASLNSRSTDSTRSLSLNFARLPGPATVPVSRPPATSVNSYPLVALWSWGHYTPTAAEQGGSRRRPAQELVLNLLAGGVLSTWNQAK